MLAAMFRGRLTVSEDPKGYVFIDRDGKHFRHILNWLRDGVVPTLTDAGYSELTREAEYYQLLGLVEGINSVLNKRKEGDELDAELTRADIIKCIQYNKVKFRGINFSGLDLSKLASLLGLKLSNLEGFLLLSYVYSWQICLSELSQLIHLFCWNLFLEKVLLMSIDDCDLDLSYVDFSYASLQNVIFSRANLHCAKFQDVDAEGSIFHNANLRECEFTGANLQGALLAGANLQSANLQDACLVDCSFRGANLRSAHLQTADLTNANFEGANLEGANLKGAKLNNANLKGANLQRAYLRHVNLQNTHLEDAKLDGANLLGAIR
ncbi:hypothetical protein SADUNF_Sadunf13G0051600 [Salix dunnii]|uniref:Potassium channel tetramerisation-type BTB domain-containing protein n=1 Tax=Salix dunnii TaxID=1413687 RepID=A0A835JGI9_9ROSI|nr:hypothetical protein SADUNF_Sadunf13G0051600 [Salix dunnii]